VTWKIRALSIHLIKAIVLVLSILKSAPSQRHVKSTRLDIALCWNDCPCILPRAPSQRDIKSMRLVNALGYGSCACILRSAPSQKDNKSTRLVSALGWGDCPCMMTRDLSQRDVKSTRVDSALGWCSYSRTLYIDKFSKSTRHQKNTRLVNALGWGDRPCVLIDACSKSTRRWKYAPSQRTWLRRLSLYKNKWALQVNATLKYRLVNALVFEAIVPVYW